METILHHKCSFSDIHALFTHLKIHRRECHFYTHTTRALDRTSTSKMLLQDLARLSHPSPPTPQANRSVRLQTYTFKGQLSNNTSQISSILGTSDLNHVEVRALTSIPLCCRPRNGESPSAKSCPGMFRVTIFGNRSS